MKRTPLQRKTPLRAKTAPSPRRSTIKVKAKPAPPADEKRHLADVAAMPCLVCGRPATVHHVTGYADRMGRFSRSHRCVVPLCPCHHQIQHGPRDSVEALGHQGFYLYHGIDLKAVGDRLWREGEEINKQARSNG